MSEQDLLQAIQLITGEGKLEIRNAIQEADYTHMGVDRSGEKLLLDFHRWLFS